MLAVSDSSAALSSLPPLTFGRAESRSPGPGREELALGPLEAVGQLLAARLIVFSLYVSCLYKVIALQTYLISEYLL